VVELFLSKREALSQTPVLTKKIARGWWLMPIILVTQELEIRRIAVSSQPREIVHETLSQKHPSRKKGWWSGSRCRS
jgi:hypothetical protein